MKTYKIQVNNASPTQEISVTLDGVPFYIKLSYLDRPGAWYMSVLDGSKTMLVEGIRVIEFYPLLAQYSDGGAKFPKGSLFVAALSYPPVTELGRDSLGVDWNLYYISN